MDFSDNMNLLQPSGFRVIVDRSRFPNITFFAQSVQMPSLSVNVSEAPFRHYETVPRPGDSFSYGEVAMQVLLDEDMNVYNELRQWLVTMVEENYVEQGEDEPTEVDLILSVLTSHNNIARTITFRNAFITSLDGFTMEANVDATSPITFGANFRFAYYEISG